MNGPFLSYLIQKNYLLKKEKNIYVKHLDVRGEHSVLSDLGALGSSSPCPGGTVPGGGAWAI